MVYVQKTNTTFSTIFPDTDRSKNLLNVTLITYKIFVILLGFVS